MLSQKHVEQIGGTHYVPADKFGHWDLCDQHNVSYLEASATKYVSRWRKKNGFEDLQKAVSYIDKRLAALYPEVATQIQGAASGSVSADPIDSCFNRNYRSFTVPTLALMKWFKNVNMGKEEEEICLLILCWEDRQHLVQAKERISMLIEAQS